MKYLDYDKIWFETWAWELSSWELFEVSLTFVYCVIKQLTKYSWKSWSLNIFLKKQLFWGRRKLNKPSNKVYLLFISITWSVSILAVIKELICCYPREKSTHAEQEQYVITLEFTFKFQYNNVEKELEEHYYNTDY